MRLLIAVARIVIAGLLAPLRHPLGFALSSLPWLAVTIALHQERAAHRSWILFLGFGGQGWDYEPTARGDWLQFFQILAAILFVTVWMRWVAGLQFAGFHVDAKRIVLRALRVCVALLKLGAVAIGITIVWLIAGNIARDIIPHWYGSGGDYFIAVFLAASVWLACRFAPVLPSAAFDDPSIGFREAWRLTRGRAACVFLSLLPAGLLIAMMKRYVLQGYLLPDLGETIPIAYADLVLDTKQLWKFTWQLDPVPLSLIVSSALISWIQWTWLFATLALAYRHLRDRRDVDRAVQARQLEQHTI